MRQTAASRTSISPRSESASATMVDRPDRPPLVCSVEPRAHVSIADQQQMYELLESYFAGTDRARFDADLQEKDLVILLRDACTARVQGFSTLMRMCDRVDGRDVIAFFSGDTIVDRDYWGETELSRAWGQTVFAEVDRIRAERPDASIYWFLICSGYKTWRFLPVFFRTFYPNPREAAPDRVRRIADALAAKKFGDEYCPAVGVVRFRQAMPLRHGVASITPERLRDPRVAFFVERNPGHACGDELVCLAELTRENLTRAGERMVAFSLGGPAAFDIAQVMKARHNGSLA